MINGNAGLFRPYVRTETHERILKYAVNMGIKQRTREGITNAYTQLINSLLDEKGNVKDRVVLSEGQEKIIQDIAAALGSSRDKVVQELINNALLIYTTHISMREIIVAASPLIMDDLVTNNPEIAKEILQGLKRFRP